MAAPLLTFALASLLVHGWLATLRRSVPCLAAAGEGLAFLAAHLFVFVTDALALVRLRLAHAAHLGGILPHLLLVRALDDDGRRIGQLHRDALGRRHADGIGIAYRQHQRLLIHARLVADALDL